MSTSRAGQNFLIQSFVLFSNNVRREQTPYPVIGMVLLLYTIFFLLDASKQRLSDLSRVANIRQKTCPSVIEDPGHPASITPRYDGKTYSHCLEEGHRTCLFTRGVEQQ
jgi:hypothetical protein